MSLRLFAVLGVAMLAPSCVTREPLPTLYTNFSPKMAYDLGFRHGSEDRLAGRSHSPRVNQPDQVPSAHRKDYLWGYTQGYQHPHSSGAYGSK